MSSAMRMGPPSWRAMSRPRGLVVVFWPSRVVLAKLGRYLAVAGVALALW